MAKITFGELLEKMAASGWASEELDTSELKTPASTDSSDPSTTTWEVLTVPHSPEQVLERHAERLQETKVSGGDSVNDETSS